MITYTLVISFHLLFGGQTLSIVSVSGFTSLQNCEIAANQVINDLGRSYEAHTCIEVK